MKILVCIKQVPDTTDIKWTENNTIQREGVESIINPYDVYALETALKLKKILNAEITVLSMGPNQAEDILRKALAIGCDNAVLLSDKKFAGADTYATGKTIAEAIKAKIPDFDLIICGQFAIDGDTAQTGPTIANNLDIPQVTYVKDVLECSMQHLTVKREIEEGTEIVKVLLPALICILKGYEEPTRPTINGIIKAQDSKITVYSHEDIGLAPEETGLRGSPTYVSKAFRPETKGQCVFVKSSDEIIKKLEEFDIING